MTTPWNCCCFRRRSPAQHRSAPVPDWVYVEKELRRRGVTRLLLWEEYRAEHPDGYGYSRFCDLYEAWKGRVTADDAPDPRGRREAVRRLRRRHRAGVRPDSPAKRASHEALRRGAGRLELHLCRGALERERCRTGSARTSTLFAFLGGVPKVVVCDNLKAGVTKPDRYEPGINRTYPRWPTITAPRFCRRGRESRATRPRSRSAVQIVERWILARLRNRRFFSLAELNAAIRSLVAELNARLMRKLGVSRAELFADDRPAGAERAAGRALLSMPSGSAAGSRPTTTSRSTVTTTPCRSA